MKTKDEWIPFQELDWNDPENNIFSIDTRDFHCGYRLGEKEHKDIKTLSKYPHFFFTKDEIVELITRYYDDSGGKGDWRFFCIDGFENWNLKYIRIWRGEYGFLVCDSEYRAIRKDILNRPVEKSTYNNRVD